MNEEYETTNIKKAVIKLTDRMQKYWKLIISDIHHTKKLTINHHFLFLTKIHEYANAADTMTAIRVGPKNMESKPAVIW